MARLTVEDCLEKVDNRYDLVILSSKRARQIVRGAEPLVDEDGDKPSVIALREIAEGLVNRDNVDKLGTTSYDEETAQPEFPPPE